MTGEKKTQADPEVNPGTSACFSVHGLVYNLNKLIYMGCLAMV